MRPRLLLLLALGSFPLLAQKAPSPAKAAEIAQAAAAEGPAADAAWRDVLARAGQEKKPVVIFFKSYGCPRCSQFERESVPHPTIERRLPRFVFATLPGYAGEAGKAWGSTDPGIAFFDRAGVLRVRWTFVPDTMNFGIILDSVAAVAGDFERAVELAEAGTPDDGELHAAIGLGRLGRITAARASLARAREHGSPATRQAAIVTAALLDANDNRAAYALADLHQVVATAVTPEIAAEAWNGIGAIYRASGATEEAARAYTAATEIAPAGSQAQSMAQQELDAIRDARSAKRGAIRILPLERQVVSGRHVVRTHVASAAVARVSFTLDGRTVQRDRPPFSATLDFGAVPERRSIRVVAFDQKGKELGRDERVVNEAGETFWIRLVEPRAGAVGGSVRVTMNVRVPASNRVQRVVVSWNDAERAVVTAAPWAAVVQIPSEQVGVLRVAAELDDGRTSEDAVLLNARGFVHEESVQLVELPITVLSRSGATPEVTPERITVREGNKVRRVESVSAAAETPLTVGLLIDVSDSMHRMLPDVQEAAIRFLETILRERDRAFLITFDSESRLLQPATSDVTQLRRQIMSIRPNGLTALHDAMVLGLLQFEGIKGRRAMIVFSDGDDMTSRYRAADVAELARRTNVPIHVIAALPATTAALSSTAAGSSPVPAATQPERAQLNEPELNRLAAPTGGTAHTLDSLAELPAVYARIEATLRAQILAFVRTDGGTRENEWRSIQVDIRQPDVDVYAPEGYYAPW